MTKIANPQNARHLENNNGQDREIARKGSVAKRSNDGVAIHPSMTNLQRGGAGIGGLGHPTATIINDGAETIATSAAASPLAHAYSAKPDLKTGKAVAPSFAQRSRTNEDTERHSDKVQAGNDCLAQAVKN